MNNPVVSIFDSKNEFLGTGFFISPSIVLTCEHVASLTKKMYVHVTYPNKKVIYRLKVESKNKDYDMAMCSIPDSVDSYMKLYLEGPPIIGQTYNRVTPHLEKKKKNEMKYECISEFKDDKLNKEIMSYRFEGMAFPGSSGSPVIDENGLVIGMIWAGKEPFVVDVNTGKRHRSPVSYAVPAIDISLNIKKLKLGI